MHGSPAQHHRSRGVFTLIKADRLAGHYCRNRMFVNQLRLPVASQQNAEIIKPSDNTLQFNTIDKEDCDRNLGLTHVVQECILQILSVRSHCFLTFVLAELADQAPRPKTSMSR